MGPVIRLGLAPDYSAGDAGWGHELRHKSKVWSLASAPTREITATLAAEAALMRRAIFPEPQSAADHGFISTLARSAVLSASLPCGIGISFVAQIFSITRSMK